MPFNTAFPDYPAGEMPTIPIGMVDSSWCQDTCPSFLGFGVHVFIDYPNPADREIRDGHRYIVSADMEVYEHNEVLFESDDWCAVLHFIANHNRAIAEAIGLHFVWVLQNDMTPAEFLEMQRRNLVEPNPSICHSHDFLDANLCMEAAFRHQGVHGEDPVIRAIDNETVSVDATDLWNAAWACASRHLRSPANEIAVRIEWGGGLIETRHFAVAPNIIDCGGEMFPGIDYVHEDDLGQHIAYGIDDGAFWSSDLRGDNDELLGHWTIITPPETAVAVMPTLARTRNLFASPARAADSAEPVQP
jgi:hypothetical protein